MGEAISKLESMTFGREPCLKKKLQRRMGFDKGLKKLRRVLHRQRGDLFDFILHKT